MSLGDRLRALDDGAYRRWYGANRFGRLMRRSEDHRRRELDRYGSTWPRAIFYGLLLGLLEFVGLLSRANYGRPLSDGEYIFAGLFSVVIMVGVPLYLVRRAKRRNLR
jgi:Flp pilus assembly protein TadB